MNAYETSDKSHDFKDSIIELEPFIHQVGGRSTILVLGDYICKPINDRELAFYETIEQFAPSLKPFLAHFNGTISVNFEESSDGYLVITTKSRMHESSASNSAVSSPPSSCVLQAPSSPYQKFVTKYRIKLCRPLKEIIIESHEQDVENDVSSDLECSKRQLEDLLSLNSDKADNSLESNKSAPNSLSSGQASSNLSRSRSTSISIPNFEDAGHNGYSSNNIKSASPHTSCQSSVHSSPSKKVIYNRSTTKHNPWVLKTFSTLSEFNETMKEQKFLLLENLASNFEYPCIMDLKMGTRLHDDTATQTKIQSHESKVNETTSGALGLRITGIQIYDKSLDRFICYNKYYGRKLTPESFRSTLKMFISNDNFLHYNLLNKLIDKLKQLRSVIVQLETFRFYTSSLLLIYEGNTCKCNLMAGENDTDEAVFKECNQDPDKLFDVRIIDFAHSTHSNLNSFIQTPLSNSSVSTVSPQQDYDEGFVFGLDNLIKILSLFKNELS